MGEDNTIIFHITENQAKIIASYFGKSSEYLEDYEICELLDKIIDNLSINETIDDLPF